MEYLGRLGLPLQVHRDSSPLPHPTLDFHNIDYNQGNLRATLQLMVVCNETVLRKHIETAGRNCEVYFSADTEQHYIHHQQCFSCVPLVQK